jgi:hypothetical protein
VQALKRRLTIPVLVVLANLLVWELGLSVDKHLDGDAARSFVDIACNWSLVAAPWLISLTVVYSLVRFHATSREWDFWSIALSVISYFLMGLQFYRTDLRL